MKSFQFTLAISFGLFLTITCKQDVYRKNILENPVTMSYSLEIKYTASITCARLCLSTEGCTYFYWYNRSCYIPNTASPGNSSVSVASIYVHDDLKDNCNLDGYNAIFGGVLCIKVYDEEKKWTDAKTTCEQDGGQLLVMRTSVFYIKLEALKSLQPSSIRGHWIGGNDLTTEGEFTWIDGSDVTTKGWSTGNPNNFNGNEDCLQIKNLKFNDNNCNARRKFVCEKPLICA